MFQSIHAAAQRKLISSNNTSVDREQAASNPPSNGIAQEVDLLPGVVLCPETDTTEQEGPLEGLGSIRMTASQLIVVPEHGPLELEPLCQEWKGLDLSLELLTSLVVRRQGGNILNEPDVGARSNLLVAVDLLLFVAPIRQRRSVSPHGNLAGVVDEFEVAGYTLELLVLLASLNTNFEQSVLESVSVGILDGNSRELLVGRVVWRGNIVRQEYCVCDYVA